MEIQLTSPQEVVYSNEEFKAIIAKIEAALKNGVITDDGSGWGEHIAVHTEYEEWMVCFIEELYGKLGWNVVSAYFDRLLFVLPTKLNTEG